MNKFDTFFATEVGKNHVVLYGENRQIHEIILKDEVEYFELEQKVKPCLPYIQSVKSCDYVLVNHKSKEILLCELKNRKKGGFIAEAEEQLKHSKYIIEFFLKILNKQDYKYALLILSKKSINKKPTKNSSFKPGITHKKTINFNDSNYA